ncbi:chaperonin family protein RbcX [Oculatella sp. LEGE 06141]|uniref:RuBisCO chaperone RbcX n=1 Tax=Oculatella sp. LEGE 06141 TaxID=1828648 RepID=UPI001881365E|nr:chaperonin family protein RbcX [Oculatella sp. LEGE 06141]MBE9180645.1 chaperonin family protein RbcX [Oculatella sp. LEGE 06141]
MDLKKIAKDTANTLVSYLTYQAVRVVLGQLSETDPPKAFWLNRFSSTGKIQNGEAYIQELLRENQELAFRIMTVRAHLAEEVTDFLPEMVRTGIQQANMEYRRQYLERITQLNPANPPATVEPSPATEPEPDSDSLPG